MGYSFHLLPKLENLGLIRFKGVEPPVTGQRGERGAAQLNARERYAVLAFNTSRYVLCVPRQYFEAIIKHMSSQGKQLVLAPNFHDDSVPFSLLAGGTPPPPPFPQGHT
jgi:hypothetical protein